MGEYELDEMIIDLEEHQYCDICGHKLEDEDEVYITATGHVACSLIEVWDDMKYNSDDLLWSTIE